MLVDYNHKLSLTTSNNYVVWLPRFWVFFTAMIDVKEQTCGLVSQQTMVISRMGST